ncbi:MAG TPA: hypothetical protein QF924_11690 [Pseudomonadales bacterium]|jgi:hypothetical protein|nr:hypothetical protein [Pseudomonadales bacterium]
MNLRYFIVAGSISVVVTVTIQNDGRRLDCSQDEVEENVVFTSRKDKPVEEVISRPGRDASPAIAESYGIGEPNVDGRRQAATDRIEIMFETLVSNPNNRIEKKKQGLTLVEDTESKTLYYFLRDTDHPAYPAVLQFVRPNGTERIEFTQFGQTCEGLSRASCTSWSMKTKQQLEEQDAQQLDKNWIMQCVPGNTINHWSASLGKPLDDYTKETLIQTVTEEYVAAGLMPESDNDAETWLTGRWGRTCVEAIEESDERVLDRVEPYLTEEQYRSYVEFLGKTRTEDEDYLLETG